MKSNTLPVFAAACVCAGTLARANDAAGNRTAYQTRALKR